MKELTEIVNKKYEAGFVTQVESEVFEKGLNETIIKAISKKNNEPSWLLKFRLTAFKMLQKMQQPKWPSFNVPIIDLQNIHYFASPKKRPESLDEVDPAILRDFEKLGIPLHEQAALAGVAVDVVFDSVSIATTYKEKLGKLGIIFGSFNDAVQQYPDLVKKYLATVVPMADNYWTCLNSCVFSDGSFVYIPPGVRCPLELSTYFRINEKETGQFERTLIIADKQSYVSYLEGCTAPINRT
jgi:Fe-S cluster assembly protein SufB